MNILTCIKREDIIFHFNKMHLSNPEIPMWTIKHKGETHYVNHIDVSAGVGFSTKESPDNPHTKGSLKIKGKLNIDEIDNQKIANVY